MTNFSSTKESFYAKGTLNSRESWFLVKEILQQQEISSYWQVVLIYTSDIEKS